VANTAAADLANLSADEHALFALLSSASFKAALPADFGAADVAQLIAGVKESFSASTGLGVFGIARSVHIVDVSYGSAAGLDADVLARTTQIDFGMTSFGNGGEAGQSGQDFNESTMASLLLTPSGTVRTDLSPRTQEYVLGRLLNRDLTGAGNGAPSISVPSALLQAVALAGSITDRAQRMAAIGRYFGWLIGHEMGHALGMPDEYKLDGAGKLVPLVSTPSFMGSPNNIFSSALQMELLRIGSHSGDVTFHPEQVTALVRYLHTLAKKEAFVAAPPVDGSATPASAYAYGAGVGQTTTQDTGSGTGTPAFDAGMPVHDSLQGAALANASGWTLGGAVDVGQGRAVLSETAAAQSRLAQVFRVNAGDHVLSFTLADRSLVGNTGFGPSDAFEVALLDAGTGLPVLKLGNLSRSDALLNLQTDGTERLAAGVRRVANADGSVSYYIDLPNALVGKAVLLSFDLLGFGAASSHITVRDLQLISDPVATADSVAIDEDGVASGNVLDNDITSGAAITQVVLVNGPAHGQFVLGNDGHFSYTPAANFNGTDSFSYSLVDAEGRSSNTAVVSITVRAVNDAPTLQGSSFTATAGVDTAFNPLAKAQDVEGDALHGVLVTGPAHGSLMVMADGSFRYKANIDYVGADSFSYKVNDGQADSAVVTVAITVEAAAYHNDAPVAVNSLVTGTEDQALTIKWSDFAISDAQGTPLFVVITRLPVDGQLQRKQADGSWAAVVVGDTLNAAKVDGGLLRFVPAANASGGAGYNASGDGDQHAHYARLAFTAFDGELYSSQAQVVIDITAVADAPVLTVAGTVRGLEDTPVVLPLVAAALTDADGSEQLVLTLTGVPAGAQLSDGVHSFSPTADHPMVNLAGWKLDALRLSTPHDFNGTVVLQLQATALERATGAWATTTQDVQVLVGAVADAPSLSLAARDVSLSREIVATGWETPANANNKATVVTTATLEGWSVLPARVGSGKTAAFEVWASGDKQYTNTGNQMAVQAAAGNGGQFLGLGNGVLTTYQTVGIERSINTIDGAVYTFNFDYAGGLGFAAANNLIGIYVDGQRIATYSSASSATALNWQALSYSFTGNGQARKLTVQLEGPDATAKTLRMVMLDHLSVVETLPQGVAAVWGLADNPVALPKVTAKLSDTFGGESLTLAVLGLPAGAVLSDGVHRLVIGAAGSPADVTGWDLSRLDLLPPAGFTGTLALQVRATSTEASNGASASVLQSVQVNVLAGAKVATPAGVNPFVTTAAGARSSASSAGSSAVLPPVSLVASPLVDARGQVQFSTPPVAPKTPEEEAQADLDRAHAISDAWLADLEKRAQAQWSALAAGG
jgi:hypothetical protein